MYNGFDTEILLRKLFDTTYGFFNHEETNDRPLALVAMHDGENLVEGSYMSNLIRDFHKYKIHRLLGISFNEFIEYPPYFIEQIIAIALKDAKDQEAEAKSLQDAIGDEKGLPDRKGR